MTYTNIIMVFITCYGSPASAESCCWRLGGGRERGGGGGSEKERKRSGGVMPGCPIWLWTSSVLRSVWECQRRLSAGSQRWLPESEQAPPRPWLKAEKGRTRSSSWELWVKTAPWAPCVWRAPPPVSISTARCGGGERSFAPSQMQDASYFIKFAGEASRMAVSQEPSHQATGLWCGEC